MTKFIQLTSVQGHKRWYNLSLIQDFAHSGKEGCNLKYNGSNMGVKESEEDILAMIESKPAYPVVTNPRTPLHVAFKRVCGRIVMAVSRLRRKKLA